ncbi:MULTISPECIES: amidohydrolase family protein [Atopobiaceae]|uniref:Cytosine/adenosine deaminase n=1 Tax=Parafannyhessea umbonata TaxID=604330 RepID=A0A1H9N750_9ACTN|nr:MULTISPECIES: amidohydrolase family protein [Atopobiaceae]SEH38021.1 Cytosine/adenosine deaminase [Parafannyhessea umbonata]SER31253.1 Cytosine/adenosine deaminase [Parafannyhessea umbonata]SJZ40651.1 Cytosine/adenosine deaminase [Olsenella sp. KH1P3]
MNDKATVTLYTAPLVIPVTGPVICDGAVAVRDGRVLHVGTRDWVEQKLRDDRKDAGDVETRNWHGLVTPGLVNAHTHLQYTGMASVGQSTYPSFRDWELAFNKIYDSPERKPWREWAHEGARMMVEAGTTAAADIASDLEAADALTSQGMHGITYWEVMDWNNEDWQRKGVQDLLAQIEVIRSMGVTEIGISPHAPYSLGSGPLLDLPDIARRLGMRLHVHLGETPAEAGKLPSKLTNQTSWAWNRTEWSGFNDLKRAGAGASAIQFLDQLAVLGPDVHIAHGVHASREDRRILRQRGVSVALCPRSNRITCTQKNAPIARYLEEGNPLSVGTDSLSSCPSLDVLDDVSVLYDLAIAQGYEGADLSHRLIRMMTLGGAESMGLNCGPKRIGQINVGASADLAFFDIPVNVSSPQALEDTLEEFVRHGSGSCKATIIEGSVVYDRIWN